MSETQPIRVLIVDDHAMVRSGLKNFLYAYEWILPVGEAANGAEAVAFCTDQDVDVVLMDVVMQRWTAPRPLNGSWRWVNRLKLLF